MNVLLIMGDFLSLWEIEKNDFKLGKWQLLLLYLCANKLFFDLMFNSHAVGLKSHSEFSFNDPLLRNS